MKKLVLCFVISLFSCSVIFAQKAQETILKYDKNEIAGYTVSFSNLPVNVVKDAVNERMQKIVGKKVSTQKGYNVCLNQKFSQFGSESYDVYYKVEESGKRDMKNVKIDLFVCKGNLNAISSVTDPEVAKNIITFMNEMLDYALDYNNNQEVIALNNKLAKVKAQRKEYEEKIVKLQKEINALDLKLKETTEEMNKLQEELNSKNK